MILKKSFYFLYYTMKNWQFWILVVLILISDFVIMVYINLTYEDDKITRQTIVDISRDTYQIKDSVDSYWMNILREVRK